MGFLDQTCKKVNISIKFYIFEIVDYQSSGFIHNFEFFDQIKPKRVFPI